MVLVSDGSSDRNVTQRTGEGKVFALHNFQNSDYNRSVQIPETD